MGATKKARINRAAPARLDELAEFRYRLRKFLSFSEVASEVVGISAQQYQLLQVVAAVPEGRESSISYVAERMLVRHNSAVELVDRAVKSGLVCRVADESDHRRSLLEITDRGAEVLARLVAEHLAEIDAEGPEMMRALQRLIAGRAGSSRRTGER
jgi:DNA-binding MarR family transcriptional regulator